MSNNFFTATKAEESGYSDPFGDSCPNNFDIVQFINDDLCSTPVDSPTDSSRFLNAIQQQQHQQLLLQSVNNNGNLNNSSIVLDNNLMYGNNGMSRMNANGGVTNDRLPDSPPITDISGGGLSSASPSSGGSASDDSPFSPPSSADPYNRGYHQNGILLSMPNNIKNSTNNSLITNDDVIQHQMQIHQRIIMQQQQQQQLSPQSEFLSPYPPSQSTPGSQHSSLSSAQVSPPGLIMDNQRVANNNYLIQQQQLNQQQQYGIYNDDEINQQQIQQTINGGYKRRRTNQVGMSNSTSQSTNSNTLANIKCENGIFNRNNNNSLQNQNCNYFQQQNVRSNSNCGNSSISNCIPQPPPPQSQPPPPPSSHHSMDGDSDEAPVGIQKTIKFLSFFPETWSRIYDGHQCLMDELKVHIVADKGFNFSTSDNCFVNQKKNHFQITVHIDKVNANHPYYVRMSNGELQVITEFVLVFGGAKYEMPNAELVAINQSHADRKPVPHEGVKFNIDPSAPTKLTVQRLHFSATTMCNHRKNGKPNPEQKYFLLVLKLMARTSSGLTLIQAHQSDRVIVRASNPGQFEQPETETQWQRNEKANGNVLHFNGQVAIGTDTPVNDSKLTVKGNIFSSGPVMHPSDRRVKENIAELDTNEALSRISQMRIVEYAFKPEIAKQWGLTEESRHRVGVIAQELEEVLPDAVRDNGEFLTVDDTRIFYDTVAAAQELYRLTGNLEYKISEVEKISQKLARFAQKKKILGSRASEISDFSMLDNTLSKDNKNYMSYSRTSLTSAPAIPYSSENTSKNNNREKNSKNPHKRHRSLSSASSYSYCHRGRIPDNALCTSKVTQGTIVTLVVIMALCLMAMCTLYVMDWYNRTYIYAPHHHYHPGLINSHREHLNMHGKGDGIHNGIGQNVENVGENGLEYIVEKIIPAPPKEPEKIIWAPPKEPLAVPLGSHCSALSSYCPVFCCNALHSYLLDGIPTEQFNSFKQSSFPKQLESPVSDGLLSSLDSKKLASGALIQVLNLNTTLDSSYCRGRTGCDARKGIYHLDVPVSPFLPTIPLLLKFSVDESLFVDNCGHLEEFKHKSCEFENDPGLSSSLNNNPTSKRISENVFEVPVGSFMQSAFVFRIGYTSESCRMLDNQLGHSFDEYRIVFYRTCGNLGQRNFTV